MLECLGMGEGCGEDGSGRAVGLELSAAGFPPFRKERERVGHPANLS